MNEIVCFFQVREVNQNNNVKLSKKTHANIIRGAKKILKTLNKKDSAGSIKLKHLISSKVKGSKKFRKVFEKNKEKKTKNLKPTRTRERMFNFVHSPEIEKSLYSLWGTSFLNNEVRSYLYKVANNLTKTNLHIAKFNSNMSEFCKNCWENGSELREDFKHIYFECQNTKKLISGAKKVFEEVIRYDPGVILINDNNNKSTYFEKIISGIVCYVIFTNRNKTNDKIFQMNGQFNRIITASAKVSNWFGAKVIRYLNVEVDPF